MLKERRGSESWLWNSNGKVSHIEVIRLFSCGLPQCTSSFLARNLSSLSLRFLSLFSSQSACDPSLWSLLPFSLELTFASTAVTVSFSLDYSAADCSDFVSQMKLNYELLLLLKTSVKFHKVKKKTRKKHQSVTPHLSYSRDRIFSSFFFAESGTFSLWWVKNNFPPRFVLTAQRKDKGRKKIKWITMYFMVTRNISTSL